MPEDSSGIQSLILVIYSGLFVPPRARSFFANRGTCEEDGRKGLACSTGPASEGILLINVPYSASDRDMLLGYLQRQRDLVLWKLDGLQDSDARSVGTPTGLTIHGVVHHLMDVERSWLR